MSAEAAPRLRFYVATHKPWPLPPPPLYQPLGVGGYRPPGPGRPACDADGDSIADRNPHYSELTGWYWIWKNVRDVEMVGLCHYRRYFFFDTQHPNFQVRRLFMEPSEINMTHLAKAVPNPVINAAWRENTVIIPRHDLLPETVEQHYVRHHRRSDWEAFIETVAEISPEHGRHLPYFQTERWLYLYNMMVAPWPFFDDYMSLLMAVMTRLETRIEYPDDPYQMRVPAFLAERLFTLHLLARRTPLFEVPVLVTDRLAH
jgi:hypothetical protein